MDFKIWVITSEFQNYADHSVWFLFVFFQFIVTFLFWEVWNFLLLFDI